IANQALSKEDGEQIIEAEEADAISWGKLYIANPDLVERFAADTELNEPNADTFYGDGPEGYTDYPFMKSC
ncbi:MAG: alkene reductase, partial [Akkermansiaceae bacterium]